MPIYEYQCVSSGERFEIQQKMSDPPIQTCDQLSCPCGKALPVTKVISAPAIMFKGTGWYVTDYSDKMKEPASKSENKGTPAEANKSESKSESTTDSKSNSTNTETGKSGSSSTTPAASTPSTGSSGSNSSSGSTSSSGSSASAGSGSSSATSSNS